MLESVLSSLPIDVLGKALIGLLWPNAPLWIPAAGSALFVLVKELVLELSSDEYKDLPGSQKMAIVVGQIRETFDESFDDVPEWAELSEEARDRIIGGLAELALFCQRIAAKSRTKRLDVKSALRGVKRSARKLRSAGS